MNASTEITPQPLDVDELRDIETRAERVSALLRKSATLWLEIAREVHDAKEQLSADAYGIFLQKACLTPGIADKMPAIAKASELYSDEAKKHIQKLEGWSTLYEVAKLTSSEKQEFFKALDTDPEIDVSRAFIQRFKKSKSSKANTKISIAEIKVNENDIARMDYNQFVDLQQKIDDIARIIDRLSPAVSLTVNETNISNIENTIVNNNSFISSDVDVQKHCDDLLLITIPAADSDCSFSHVAF